MDTEAGQSGGSQGLAEAAASGRRRGSEFGLGRWNVLEMVLVAQRREWT